MFREMRRIKQAMRVEEIIAVLERCSNGVLACHGDDGYPYAVPLNFVYYNGRIYFHCAKDGHKIDAIKKDPKVSFAVVDQDTIVSEEYTSYFRSAHAFGRARFTEGEEWLDAFRALVEKYSGHRSVEEKEREIAGCGRSLIAAIDVDHLTGKEAKELKSKEPSL
ncbi:pyridoxamine 5'-phosphate oxidase family protein [Alkalibacter rhizosphaerae]|uniref:Pyridoxamine 5'-phosphate oxidase family protein n=1 Tax=Alkalibacter rhizosphaerae TaxID=2815577 RepID=A0A974XIX2_9FIRM|nr:pyridoxamine 5'-phosphate oxidase family protein [Alkalibacter rhizosphaerae]QSX09213.1 pyridoxamine 5'-phosphate oxidase family protein [Alkalibacter rhizosphaerae]